MQLLILGLSVLVGLASAQKISFGGCPNVPVKENFDVKQYAGKWYEIAKNPVPFGVGLKCCEANYGYEGDYVSVFNKGISIKTGEEDTIRGNATIPDKNVPAKLKVKFPSMPFAANYWVLDTDYKQYSVVFSCFSVLKVFHAEYIWILSRTPTLDDNIQQNIYKLLDDNKINRSKLTQTIQDC